MIIHQFMNNTWNRGMTYCHALPSSQIGGQCGQVGDDGTGGQSRRQEASILGVPWNDVSVQSDDRTERQSLQSARARCLMGLANISTGCSWNLLSCFPHTLTIISHFVSNTNLTLTRVSVSSQQSHWWKLHSCLCLGHYSWCPFHCFVSSYLCCLSLLFTKRVALLLGKRHILNENVTQAELCCWCRSEASLLTIHGGNIL